MPNTLVTMSDSEYDAYLRDEPDERTLEWLDDGLPTLFQMTGRLTAAEAAEADARIQAMGLKSWSDLLAEFGGVV